MVLWFKEAGVSAWLYSSYLRHVGRLNVANSFSIFFSFFFLCGRGGGGGEGHTQKRNTNTSTTPVVDSGKILDAGIGMIQFST